MAVTRRPILFGTVLTIAILGGCGGVENASYGALTTPRQTSRHASWIKPGSSSGTLIYVSSRSGSVYEYSYPDGTLVGTLTGFDVPMGLCSDADGNVWITDFTEHSSHKGWS